MMAYLACGAYGLYLLIIIGGGLAAVLSPNLVRAFLGLIAALFGVAGMYLLLQSPFLAFMQLLIYIGAVSVLIFFGIMLTDAHRGQAGKTPFRPLRLGRSLIAALLPVLLLTPTVFLHPASMEKIPHAPSLADIGQGLMEQYLLPFELISVILCIAMVGGVFLALDRRNR